MKELAAQGMAEGAVGLSTGLDYPPGSYARTEELVELCRVVARCGGIYASHTRDISNPEKALEEAIRIGTEAGAPVHISHLKAVGPENRGRAADRILPIIDRARKMGSDVTFDSYPYEAGSGGLTRVLPDWMHEGGPDTLKLRLQDPVLRARAKKEKREIYGFDWDKIYLVALPSGKNQELVGKHLLEAAAMMQLDPVDFVWDLLVEENLACTIIFFLEAEEDLRTIMKHPAQMMCSDSLLRSGQSTHPRTYGTFPRVLGRYVRELGVLRLEEAIRKMTSFPAQRFRLKGRGLLKEGFAADIVIFDEERVRDTATYWDSCRYPEGIHYVIVNGQVVVQDGEHTGTLPGRILRLGAPL
jgi:N-acyl-D-amino-acid deacylase